MAQFDIYRGQGHGAEFLLDLQDNMLDSLSTRVVAPLVSPDKIGPPMRTLNPSILVGGNTYVLMTHLLAAIPAKGLGEPVGSAAGQREEIVAAIDLLFTGV